MKKYSAYTALKGLLIVILSVLVVTGINNQAVSAASSSKVATLKSCLISSSKKQVVVKAKISKKTKEMGKKLYLIELDTNASVPKTTKAKPVASTKAKKGTVTFKTALNNGKKNTKLFSKFVVAYKSGRKYKVISDAGYITNPDKLATYKSSYPKTTSKKGLQVENMSDSMDLGTQHTVLNWTINDIVQPGGLGYSYKGKMYYFNYNRLNYYDDIVHAYNEAGSKVTVILLLRNNYRSDLKNLMYTGSSAKYSSFKVSSKSGSEQFEAIMSFLAQRYGQKSHLVSGWILGNEMGNTVEWNYGGNKSLNGYIDNYVRAFRICQTAVASVNKNAHVYLSLDYYWNRDLDGAGSRYFSSKTILDTFYKKLKKQGLVDWYIAYHAYSEGLTSAPFWDDSLALQEGNAEIVNFNNLEVLTNYVKKHFGKNVKVMLSEQSFSSQSGELTQAAAYAYAYYISEANSMVEAFIYGRHRDNSGEINPATGQTIPWGLLTSAGNKRAIWDIFMYIDSPDSTKVTKPLLKYISTLKSWSKISGFKSSKFSKMPSKKGKVPNVAVMSASYNKLKISWTEMPQATGYQIYRATSKNGKYKLVKTVTSKNTTSYTNGSLAQGQTYYYKIRFYKKFKTGVKLYGAYSAAAGTTSVAPGNITSISGADGKVQLSWSATSNATGYQLYRATSKNGNYSRVANLAAGITNYTDKYVSAGAEYYYKVRAYVSIAGRIFYGEFSDAVEDMVSAAAPQFTTTEMRLNKIDLNWTTIANATGYQIYAATSINGTYTKIKTIYNANTGSHTRFVDEDKEQVDYDLANREYYYKIRSFIKNANGTAYSSYSDICSVGAYSDSLKITSVVRDESTGQIVVQWTQCDLRGNNKVDGYELERADSSDGIYTRINIEKLTTTSFADDTAETTGSYYYRIRAYKTVSTGQIAYSSYSDVRSIEGGVDNNPDDIVVPDNSETQDTTSTGAEQSTETKQPSETEQPVETEQPAETEQPVETEQPAETEQPIETEQPAESLQSTETEQVKEIVRNEEL